MGKKLILLGSAVAAFALWGAHAPWGSVPTASADPWSATMNIGMLACNTVAGDPLPCNNDANQDVGEVVTTYLDTALPANHGSFYDAPETQITGLMPQAGVPMGDQVGQDQFTIYLDGAGCSGSGGRAADPEFQHLQRSGSRPDAAGVPVPRLRQGPHGWRELGDELRGQLGRGLRRRQREQHPGLRGSRPDHPGRGAHARRRHLPGDHRGRARRHGRGRR